MYVIVPIRNDLPVTGPFTSREEAQKHAHNFTVNYNIRELKDG